MEKRRCTWVNLNNEDYVRYHDSEWGVPVRDDQKLFEFIILESAQAGLSWEIILKKRSAYRDAFYGFDPQKIAKMKEREVTVLLKNAGIIRNRKKIESAIQNARVFLEIQREHGSFARYLWQWCECTPVPHKTKNENIIHEGEIAAKIAYDLKKRGFSFFGPTTCHAYLQAIGVLNEHEKHCFKRKHKNSE